eukprot:Blabericola_migrator_1__11230@NODE_65_length_15685_cov_31_404533_g58_i0_p1_GENE_NODE_65_length_15685_cov_31_404533_g58_i0NODE_65_length_15685_cov_31_404533_g58_i0_p1_ORF_typecomplete_len938_score126_04PDEase_I/PF00233_19/9e65HD/PF01966_22/0_036AA_permease/PF00324_21/0_052DUF1053/PF06327_14/0_055DUF1053/PF06327_14/4_9e03Otopetrin/PF03189_13/0_43Otopetrin/PF03189_13/3_9e03_NODE_65_length_15685_cov_31_404533_g58_i01126114074
MSYKSPCLRPVIVGTSHETFRVSVEPVQRKHAHAHPPTTRMGESPNNPSAMSPSLRPRSETNKSLQDKGLRESESSTTVSRAMWEEVGTRTSQRYKRDLYRKLWLDFRDPELENAYGAHVRATFKARNAFAGAWTGFMVLILWISFSVLMHTGVLYLPRTGLAWVYDATNAVSLCCCLLLLVSRCFRSLRREGEIWFYCLSFAVFTMWMVWIGVVLAVSKHNGDNNSLSRILSRLQFKFWTDTAALIVLFMICTLYDQLMATRTKFVLWLHVTAAALYALSRALTIPTFGQFGDLKIRATIIIIGTIQIVVACGLVVQSYMGRYQKELIERVAFIDIHDDQVRLQEVRDAQKKRKKAKGESMVEELIHQIRKAQTSIQAAAFEKSAQGDANLLELDEILRQCVEILLDTDDLFAVGGGNGEAYRPLEEGDDEENQYVDILNTQKRGGGHHTDDTQRDSNARLTAEDVIRRKVDQLEYYTSLMLPPFNLQPDFAESIGVDSSLKLLEIFETNPNVLVEAGYVMMKPHLDFLSIPDLVMIKYLYQLQRRYYTNPYHNSCHGAVVAHMALCITRLLGLSSRVTQLDIVALVISGLGHDVGHPGRNNNYYINQAQTMAQVYKDLAVLEQYHSFLTFRYASIASEVNIFQGLSDPQYRVLRALMIENILMTDMAQHFSSISKFRLRRASEKFDPLKNLEDAQFVLRLCIKMADLSHGLIEWEQHVEWSLRVTEEFYQQGEAEAAGGLVMSPLCDRSAHQDFAKSQSGFLQFVVIPLASELTEVDEHGLFNNELVTKLVFNKHRWDMLKEKGETVDMPENIQSIKTAPPYYADSLLLQALKARTIEDINADPTSVSEILEILQDTKERREQLLAKSRGRNFAETAKLEAPGTDFAEASKDDEETKSVEGGSGASGDLTRSGEIDGSEPVAESQNSPLDLTENT